MADDEWHAVMNRRHICVRIGRYHGKGASTPRAADEDDVLSRNAEFVLAFDGFSSFRRGVGFFSMRLEVSRDGKDTASV